MPRSREGQSWKAGLRCVHHFSLALACFKLIAGPEEPGLEACILWFARFPGSVGNSSLGLFDWRSVHELTEIFPAHQSVGSASFLCAREAPSSASKPAALDGKH